MKLRVASTVGQNTTLTVRDDVFAAPSNPSLISQAIRVYLSNQRQGTSKKKTRAEVDRTKKKWFKQKGTGNARHGARTPSLFVGGGVAHGPTGMQNWSLKLSASMRKAALASALSAQVENVVVSDDLLQLDGKTASAERMLSKMLPEAKHILVVLPENRPMVARSLRNLEKVYVTNAKMLTTYEVAYADAIVFTKESVKIIEERLAKDSEKAKPAPVEVKQEVKKPAAKKATKPAAKAEKKAPVRKKVTTSKSK